MNNIWLTACRRSGKVNPCPPVRRRTNWILFSRNSVTRILKSPLLPEAQANEWVVLKYRDIPFKDLVVLEIRAFDALYENIMALSEEQLNEHNLAERLAQATYKHYRQHSADIRKRFKTPLKR